MRKTSLMVALLLSCAVAQEIGEAAPKIACAQWVNEASEKMPTLENLKGKVVLLEFWFST